MVKAHTSKITGAYLVREAEALSLKEALSWLKEKQIEKCIIEIDSLQLMQALFVSCDHSLLLLIIQDCKLLSSFFR